MAATLLKPTLHLHASKAHIMQNTVLQRALQTPPPPEKDFFTRMPLCHHQRILPHPAYTLGSLRGSRRSGLIVWFWKEMANSLVRKQKQGCFIWVIHVDLISVSPLLSSHILGSKDQLLSACAVLTTKKSFLVEEPSTVPTEERLLYFSKK